MKRFRTFLKKDFLENRAAGVRLVRLKPYPGTKGARAGRPCRQRTILKVSFEKEAIKEIPISVVTRPLTPALSTAGGEGDGGAPVDFKSHHGFRCRWRGLIFTIAVAAGLALLTGCNFAPSYKRPATPAPTAYKELTPQSAKQLDGWKTAEPNDQALRGKWWEVFNDPQLNALEDQVDISNQTVAAAMENFFASRAVVKQNRSQFFPGVTADPSVTRARQSAFRSNGGGSGGGGTNGFVGSRTTTDFSLPLDASWEPDFWGRIRNTVKASRLEAQASLADLESTRLSIQSEVAVDYLQIRAADAQEKLLNDAVVAYKESLRLTQVRHDTGIASDQDVAQAEIQMNSTLAQATDVGIQRAQFEHAIAVLVGKTPAEFSIAQEPLTTKPVAVPFGVPSALLERRPDIAAAERRVAEANARIGVARAAYFPTITLSGSAGYESSSTANLFTGPAFVWSLGAAAAQTIFDAGNKFAVTEQVKAQYRGQVANYRQTVLGAFQDVEDNLVALRLLSQEIQQQDVAVAASQRYLNLANDRYKLGIDSYLNVITAQQTLLGNQRTAVSLHLNQMSATVQLIKAVGGGWSGDLTQKK
jgi:NodT family efflux transporter outer membrane factor (OMF) lipoprotein